MDFEAVNSYNPSLLVPTSTIVYISEQDSPNVKDIYISFADISENRLFMLSKFGRSASRDSPMRFASSMSLERAVVLVFCDSVLDWAFEFVFSESFELKLDWWLGVATTSPSGIDTKLGMYIVCVRCVDDNDRLYHNYWSKTRPEYSIWENQLYHFLYPPWAQPYINMQ